MKKKSVFYNRGCPFGIKGAVAFSAFLAATAIAYGQNYWPRTPLTESVTGVMERVDYTIAAPDLVLTHKLDAARHYNATINLNGFSATFFADVHTSSPSTDFFAFGGATFKGTGADNVLDIGIVEGSDPIWIIQSGFTVDNATVNMDLGTGSGYNHNTFTVNVVNNGVLNWTNATPLVGKSMILNIGNGADDNAHANIAYASQAWNNAANKITVNGGSFNFNVKSGRMQFAEMTVKSLSDDSQVSGGNLGINAGGILEIGKDVNHKITMAYLSLVFYDKATYRSYSSDVIASSQGDTVRLEIAASASSFNLDLHADHTFSTIMLNGTGAQMNLSLNGSVLTFEYLDFTKLDVVIADFDNGLFRWKDGTGFDASKISATWNGQILDDIEAVLNESDGYTYLFSATVPEPAEVAAVFAALALAFALYRRRK